MRKIVCLLGLIFIISNSFAQFQNVTGTAQKNNSTGKFRWNFGANGVLYPATLDDMAGKANLTGGNNFTGMQKVAAADNFSNWIAITDRDIYQSYYKSETSVYSNAYFDTYRIGLHNNTPTRGIFLKNQDRPKLSFMLSESAELDLVAGTSDGQDKTLVLPNKSDTLATLGDINGKAGLATDNAFTGNNSFSQTILGLNGLVSTDISAQNITASTSLGGGELSVTGDATVGGQLQVSQVLVDNNVEAQGNIQGYTLITYRSDIEKAVLVDVDETQVNSNVNVIWPKSNGQLALKSDTEFNAAKVQALPFITDSTALAALIDYAPYRTPDGFIKYKLPSLSFTLNNDTESTITFNGQTVASGTSKTVSYTSPKELTFTRADGKPYVDLENHIYPPTEPLVLNLTSPAQTLTLRNLDGSYEVKYGFVGYGLPETQIFSTTWLVPSVSHPSGYEEATREWDDSTGSGQTFVGSFYCIDNANWEIVITLTNPTAKVTTLTVTGAWEGEYTATDLGDNRYSVKIPLGVINSMIAYFTVNGEYIE